MSDEIAKVHFEPSTIENIDRSVLEYLKSLSLSVDTNQGFAEVPVLWGTSERSFLSKDKKEVRDEQGTLKFPLISIRRSSFTKPLKSGGVFQGNIPEIGDGLGGSLPIGKVMYQEKTTAFANAEAMRLHGQNNYPRPNHKIVYKTVYAPMPVNVEVMYEITLRTEYQQQMNDLMLPFVTNPGTINYVLLESEGHRYEGFIQDQHQSSDNLSDFSAAERKFETKITLKVIGYLVGEGKNEDKSHFSVRQNFVEVKLPRERVLLAEIPEHEYGEYYGLPGIKPKTFSDLFFMPAATAVHGQGTSAGDKYVINLVLKEAAASPAHATTITVPGYEIKLGTEKILKALDGIKFVELTPDEDYSINGRVIIFTVNILIADKILITYVKG